MSYLIIIAQLREDLKTFFSVVGEHSALQNLNTDLKTELAECKFEYRLHHIGETYVVLRSSPQYRAILHAYNDKCLQMCYSYTTNHFIGVFTKKHAN